MSDKKKSDSRIRKKRIAILGSTGSVGENVVRTALALKDEVEVLALAANTSASRVAEQAVLLNCRAASVSDSSREEELRRQLPEGCRALSGEEGLLRIIREEKPDLIFCAIVGTGGLAPCLEALKLGCTVALASKEVMVMAGRLVTETAAGNGGRILPLDSEHSALFQCLQAGRHEEVEKLILTASGGPFRTWSTERLTQVTPEEALRHPTWSMGPKVSIDSATLMNKALEMIEARHLFGIPAERIDVLIHPQSLVHSMVEFRDGAVIAHLSMPDMRFPIQYAMTYPERRQTDLPHLKLSEIRNLEFASPDRVRFPSLDFAVHAMDAGGTMPAVLNAANEIAVERFRRREIRLTDIWKIIEKTMEQHILLEDSQLDAILSADAWARSFARSLPVPSVPLFFSSCGGAGNRDRADGGAGK